MIPRYNPLEQISDCATVEEAFNRLRGQDLITSVHAIKKKFGLDDAAVFKAYEKWSKAGQLNFAPSAINGQLPQPEESLPGRHM